MYTMDHVQSRLVTRPRPITAYALLKYINKYSRYHVLQLRLALGAIDHVAKSPRHHRNISKTIEMLQKHFYSQQTTMISNLSVRYSAKN